MKVNSETEMLEIGRRIAGKLQLPVVIELVGDVGAGKTTFTRGLAAGLGITEPVTSPSFTISKRYAFPHGVSDSQTTSLKDHTKFGELVHYDFYRLSDPGIMHAELAETLTLPQSVVVVEWGKGVADLLPADHLRLEILFNSDGSRELISNQEDLLA